MPRYHDAKIICCKKNVQATPSVQDPFFAKVLAMKLVKYAQTALTHVEHTLLKSIRFQAKKIFQAIHVFFNLILRAIH